VKLERKVELSTICRRLVLLLLLSHVNLQWMLGLRPRLKARNSFLDLVRQKNIEAISHSPSRLSTLETDDSPQHIPLPSSPSISPQKELAKPPTYTLKVEPAEKEKMAPVSFGNPREGFVGFNG
jgi:hypothetical protein